MSSFADLALYDRNGQLTAIAEVKKKPGTSRAWAAQLRRNILAHGGYYSAAFFLLITPDRLYLWKDAGASPTLVEPTYEVDSQPIFAPYFARAGVDPDNVSEQAFELAVAAWLGDLIRSEEPPEKLANEQSWLLESGFLMAVRDGRIEYEVTV